MILKRENEFRRQVVDMNIVYGKKSIKYIEG